MDKIVYILLGVLIVLVIVLIVLFLANRKSSVSQINSKEIKDELDRSNRNLMMSNSDMKDQISKRFESFVMSMSDNVEKINKRLDESMKESFKDTNQTIKEFSEKFKVIEDREKDILNLSNQINGLEKILGNNKSVGNFGEALLEQVLSAYFGDDSKLYQTQYTYKDVKPDAVIFMPKEMIFIDSKFPLHFYKLYLESENEKEKEEAIKGLIDTSKKQLKEVYDKYIINGVTSEYAVMFIPSDSLLGLIYNKCSEIVDVAKKHNVLLLSPSTLVPFISSLKLVRIDFERSKNTKKLFNELVSLSDDFARFANRWEQECARIKQLSEAHEDLNTTVNKINKKFDNIKNMNIEDEDK